MTRRLGLPLHHFAFFAQQLVIFCHHRQRHAVVLFVALFIAQQGSPARFRQKTRFGNELAVGDVEIDLTFAEHRIRAELHQILAGNQAVNLLFVVTELHLRAAGGRNNRVVGIDLFIVPAAVADLRIHHRLRQQIRRVHADGVQHRMAPGKMLFRQVAAIRTRIGNQFMGFIQLLADIQHVLRAKAEALRGFNLQRREGERQRRWLRVPLIVISGDRRRLALNALDDVLGKRAMQQPSLFILIRFTGLAGHPGGDKTFILGGNDMRLYVEEIFSDEVFNLFIAAYHQPQHRRLHASDR